MSEIRLRVISLGAGVQSTTLALMAARGDVGPMPDCRRENMLLWHTSIQLAVDVAGAIAILAASQSIGTETTL